MAVLMRIKLFGGRTNMVVSIEQYPGSQCIKNATQPLFTSWKLVQFFILFMF